MKSRTQIHSKANNLCTQYSLSSPSHCSYSLIIKLTLVYPRLVNHLVGFKVLRRHLFQTEILYAVWCTHRNYMHCYSMAAMGAFCFMYTNRHVIYMTINKRMVIASSCSYFFGVNESLNHKYSRLALFKSYLASFFHLHPNHPLGNS